MANRFRGFFLETFFFLLAAIGLISATAVLFTSVVFYLPGGAVSSVNRPEGEAGNFSADSRQIFLLRDSLSFFYLKINPNPKSFAQRYLFPFQWNGVGNFFHQFWVTFFRNGGRSVRSGKTIGECLREYLPITLIISIPGWVFGTLFGILSGIFITQSYWQRFAGIFNSVIITHWIIPTFWIGTLAIVWLSEGGMFPLFPIGGLFSISGGYNYFFDALWHLCLPVFTESFGHFWFACKITQDQCRIIKQELWWKVLINKGLNNKNLLKHLIPHLRLQQAFWSAQTLVGFVVGTVVVENLFNIPGIGFLLMNSLLSRDYPIIVGLMFFLIFWGIFAQMAGSWIVKKLTLTSS